MHAYLNLFRINLLLYYVAFKTETDIYFLALEQQQRIEQQNSDLERIVKEEVQKQVAAFREHAEAAESARKRKSEKEIKREKKIRKEQNEKIELLERQNKQMQKAQSLMKRKMTQLQAGKKEDRNLVKDLQEKLFSLQQQQQQHVSLKASAANSDQLARHVLQQGETSKTQTEKCEDKIDDHGERITDLERHQQIADGRIDQHGERLNVLEQRADNQDERIDDLQPPAGKICYFKPLLLYSQVLFFYGNFVFIDMT